MDDDGKTYLVVCFPDNSVGVYQKKKGTGQAMADYVPISRSKGQNMILRKLGATGTKGETTYELGRELCGK